MTIAVGVVMCNKTTRCSSLCALFSRPRVGGLEAHARRLLAPELPRHPRILPALLQRSIVRPPQPVADQRDAEARLIGDGEPAVLRERLALEQAVEVADNAVQLGRDELGPARRKSGRPAIEK
eukprot:COSAG04_NODE_741_length_10670_cov_20.643837_5_plen_123_part_00